MRGLFRRPLHKPVLSSAQTWIGSQWYLALLACKQHFHLRCAFFQVHLH